MKNHEGNMDAPWRQCPVVPPYYIRKKVAGYYGWDVPILISPRESGPTVWLLCKDERRWNYSVVWWLVYFGAPGKKGQIDDIEVKESKWCCTVCSNHEILDLSKHVIDIYTDGLHDLKSVSINKQHAR
jgi:hypothetical protein